MSDTENQTTVETRIEVQPGMSVALAPPVAEPEKHEMVPPLPDETAAPLSENVFGVMGEANPPQTEDEIAYVDAVKATEPGGYIKLPASINPVRGFELYSWANGDTRGVTVSPLTPNPTLLPQDEVEQTYFDQALAAKPGDTLKRPSEITRDRALALFILAHDARANAAAAQPAPAEESQPEPNDTVLVWDQSATEAHPTRAHEFVIDGAKKVFTFQNNVGLRLDVTLAEALFGGKQGFTIEYPAPADAALEPISGETKIGDSVIVEWRDGSTFNGVSIAFGTIMSGPAKLPQHQGRANVSVQLMALQEPPLLRAVPRKDLADENEPIVWRPHTAVDV